MKPKQSRRWCAGGDYAMTSNSTKSSSLQSEAETSVHLLDDWFDPIEAGLRDRVREFIEEMIESELEAALVRPRYGRRPKANPENADGPSAMRKPEFLIVDGGTGLEQALAALWGDVPT